jgi:hypothetical protein
MFFFFGGGGGMTEKFTCKNGSVAGGATGLGLRWSMDRRRAAAAEPQHARHAVPNLRAALPLVPGDATGKDTMCLGGS